MVTGKEILLAALRGEKTERSPWLPFVGAHGGALIDCDAETYLKSADQITKALCEAHTRYQADGLPIIFDLQMEAEILGCDLQWAKDGPPSVASHPVEDLEDDYKADLPAFSLEKGRFPMAFDALKQVKEKIGEEVALYGLLTGPFTLGLHLYGNDIFLDMYDDEEAVQELISYCADIAVEVAEGYLDNGADVIAIVDPMTSQISPEHFDMFVAPYVNRVFDAIHAKKGLGSIFVCGDATRVLDNMFATNCDNVSVDENISLEALRDCALKHNKSFGGNMKLTTVLLLGDENAAQKEGIACMDVAGDTGFVLAPGCDIPFDVPPANLAAVGKIVHDEYAREVARTTASTASSDSFDDIEIPNYAAEKEVILDLVTLDSKSCAPCQYILIAAEKAAEAAGIPVSVREHKIKDRDGLGYLTKLGVSQVPTICIDGVVAFSSIIPDQNTLVECIQKAGQKK